jgi:hypothetical protein
VREVVVDADLVEAVGALEEGFREAGQRLLKGKADAAVLDELKKRHALSPRFRAFLAGFDPHDVEASMPIERIRFLPSSELAAANAVARGSDWKATWFVFAESSLLGDPYFLDLGARDTEGDCPVRTAMAGQDRWQPVLAASSFAQFLRIVGAGLKLAKGFGARLADVDDEDTFREAMVPRIRAIDGNALKSGHWT